MTWDPKPFGPSQEGHDELPVIIGSGSGSGQPSGESLLIIGRPARGRVRVREWVDGAWGDPPREREVDAEALLAEIESAQQAGRRVNQTLYTVRLWLTGAGG
jgi:hypothetical protein